MVIIDGDVWDMDKTATDSSSKRLRRREKERDKKIDEGCAEYLKEVKYFLEHYLVPGAEVGYGFLYQGVASYGKYEVWNAGFSKIAKKTPSGGFLLENGLVFNSEGVSVKKLGSGRKRMHVGLMSAEALKQMIEKIPIVRRRLDLIEQIQDLVNDSRFFDPYETVDSFAGMKDELLALVNELP